MRAMGASADTVSAVEPEKRKLPSVAREVTASVCPAKIPTLLRSATAKMRIRRSLPPVKKASRLDTKRGKDTVNRVHAVVDVVAHHRRRDHSRLRLHTHGCDGVAQ